MPRSCTSRFSSSRAAGLAQAASMRSMSVMAFSTSASTFVGGWRCGIRFSASAKAFSAAANSDCSSRNPFRRATKSAVTEACPEYVATERRLAERLPLATAVR